jgi:hypothetical protein
MMTPIPDRILWCYGEYQTLYGTVDGVDFHPAAAETTAVAAYIPLSAAAYIPLSAADTHHCSVDTDELFHAYFFYVST